MLCIQKSKYILHPLLFMPVIMAGMLSLPVHASIFDTRQGSLPGNIPPVTRLWDSGKLFWCNAYLVVHRKCKVTQISPDDGYAITFTPPDETLKNCPTGGWGLTNRLTGRTLILIPSAEKLSRKEYCSGQYVAKFVADSSAPLGYVVVMIHNGKVISKVRNVQAL